MAPRRTLLAALFAMLLTGSGVAESRADTAPGLAEFRSGRFAEALRDWEANANAGDPAAALLVGILFDTGEGVAQDDAAALRWYRRAADGGSATGMFNVGVMYDAGRGVPQDRADAARWYQRAADAGFGRADYNLALMYEAGDGVGRDRARAAALYRAAAARGVDAARDHLARLGQKFAGRSENNTGNTMEAAALRDFQQAQRDLLARGTAEAGQAAELFRRAAENHNPLAEYDLGYCYENGIGLPIDKRQAYLWYRRAAAEAKDDDLRSIADTGARALQQQMTAAQQRIPTP